MDKTFEEIITKLEENAQSLKSGNLSLDECTNIYKESVELYKEAEKLLSVQKQKIEVYRAELDSVEDFDEL